MAHIGGRSFKNIEPPRPLKLQPPPGMKNNFMQMEDLIQLLETVSITLQSGIIQTEPMALLVQNLRVLGPQLETFSKDTLDRAFVVFRNASQDERLNIMSRLNLLELIELRAKSWENFGSNTYYKTKQATNVELSDAQYHNDSAQVAFLSTSPTFTGATTASALVGAGFLQQQQQQQQLPQAQLLLGPGEVIRNSGKFPKPTKIPGKTYCKDEVVIRNADSGKVNPGAKERLVQITGPSEDKINYAKKLIEDTIRRNASPVRLDPATTGGSCSSLASSNSDEAMPRTNAAGGSSISNRLSFNSAQNFMTASAAAAQQIGATSVMGALSTPTAIIAVGATNKLMRINQPNLLHSLSTNDASLEEYKYTVNVGQQLIKITGNCCDLVRVAKLVLDDYFSSAEFLASIEAGAAFDGASSILSPLSTPSTPMGPMGPPQFSMGTPLTTPLPLADSGIGLNYINSKVPNNAQEGDDEVFCDGNGLATTNSQNNGLARSRRSHFSRKDSMPELPANNNTTTAAAVVVRNDTRSVPKSNNDIVETFLAARIMYDYEHLLFYSKSPHSWALPNEWQKICEKYPAVVRNKVMHYKTITKISEETSDSTGYASTASSNDNITNITVLTQNGSDVGDITLTANTSNTPIIVPDNNNDNNSSTKLSTDDNNKCKDFSDSQSLPTTDDEPLLVLRRPNGAKFIYQVKANSRIARDGNLSYNEWKNLRQEDAKTSSNSNKPPRAPNGQKLLSKQFQMISDIIVNHKSIDEPFDTRKTNIKYFNDDDDVVEIVSESKCRRSNSTSN